jgi:hypothetical protein
MRKQNMGMFASFLILTNRKTHWGTPPFWKYLVLRTTPGTKLAIYSRSLASMDIWFQGDYTQDA